MLDTSLHFLFLDQTDALDDELPTVRPYAFHELLQDELLVLPFDEGEVALDAVEVRGVGHIEDGLDLKLLANFHDLLGFVDLKIVHEHSELLASEPLRKVLDELNEVFRVD